MSLGRFSRVWQIACACMVLAGIALLALVCTRRTSRAESVSVPTVTVPESGQYSVQEVERMFRTAGADLVVARSLRDRLLYLSGGTCSARELARMLAVATVAELRQVDGILFVSASVQPGQQLEAALAADLRESLQAALAQRAAELVTEDFWERTGCPFLLQEVLSRKSWQADHLDFDRRSWLLSKCRIPGAKLKGATVRLRVALRIGVVGYPDRGESHTAEVEGSLVR